MAKAPKGEKRGIEVAASLWVDLLAYGSMLEAAEWDPTSAAAAAALERIVEFQRLVAKHSNRHFPTFIMNDGAIVFRDLSPRSCGVTFDFLRRAIGLHREINDADRAAGYPGARAVLAVGFRVRRNVSYTSRLHAGEGKRIKEKLNEGLINAEQAINHALMARHHSDSTPELQHNYAMTKAYLVDSGGSKKGFKGPNLFIDLNLFQEQPPEWIKFSAETDWADCGMRGTFGTFEALDQVAANEAKLAGMRDAFEIAGALSTNPDIVKLIRATRVGDLRKRTTEEI
jgi:hypothetical protein